MTRVDIVFSYRNFLLKLLKTSGSTIYRHKLKSIVCIVCVIAAHKTFGLYKSIKSALNPLGELAEQANENGDDEDDGNQVLGPDDPLRRKNASAGHDDKKAEQ